MFFSYFILPQSLIISEDSIVTGEKVKIKLQTADNIPFIGVFFVYKDISNPDVVPWESDKKVATKVIQIEMDEVAYGEPFEVTFDTLYFNPGVYYFQTHLRDDPASVYWDSVVIQPEDPLTLKKARKDIKINDRKLGIYDFDGTFISDENNSDQKILKPDTVYMLAINLKHFRRIENCIHIDYNPLADSSIKKYDLMEVKVFREYELREKLNINFNFSDGEFIDQGNIPGGIALVKFRTPPHFKYYENDALFNIRLKACYSKKCESFVFKWDTIQIDCIFDDEKAAPPIVAFKTYNSLKYPGEEWRNNYPFDTFNVRLVRFGRLDKPTAIESINLQELLKENFAIATKGYFEINIVGYESHPLVQKDINTEFVINWYNSVPKTPGKPILDLNDPSQLYLATILYYCEHEIAFFLYDMQKVYPTNSKGEDFTLYFIDGPGSPGQAMGKGAARAKMCRIYPSKIFHQGEEDNRTYHFDLSLCPTCGETVSDYLNYMWVDSYYLDGKMIENVVNTGLHEFGHVLWKKKSGFSTGDILTNVEIPLKNDYVYKSKAVAYFSRFEYMSYERDDSSFENMTYGDILLEKLLRLYEIPKSWVTFLSHKPSKRNTIYVKRGERIGIKLNAKANSGLQELLYYNESGPVKFNYGTSEKGQKFIYNTYDWRIKNDSKIIHLSFKVPGKYVYRFQAQDKLHPIINHEHKSELGTFTIIVKQ